MTKIMVIFLQTVKGVALMVCLIHMEKPLFYLKELLQFKKKCIMCILRSAFGYY
jgi:hypothetical protein